MTPSTVLSVLHQDVHLGSARPSTSCWSLGLGPGKVTWTGQIQSHLQHNSHSRWERLTSNWADMVSVVGAIWGRTSRSWGSRTGNQLRPPAESWQRNRRAQRSPFPQMWLVYFSKVRPIARPGKSDICKEALPTSLPQASPHHSPRSLKYSSSHGGCMN